MEKYFLFFGAVVVLVLGSVRPACAESENVVAAQVHDDPTFPTASVRLRVGDTQIIAFQAAPTKEKRTWPATIEPTGSVEIVLAPTLLDDEKIGYLRVRALQKGSATLRVGSSTLALEITELTSEIVPPPLITAPVEGAKIWGTFVVGAEIPARTPEEWKAEVMLRVGKTEQKAVSTFNAGLTRHFTFSVDADAIPAGPLKLQPLARDAEGKLRTGEPLYVTVIRPDPSLMISGACADPVEGTRPQRYGEKAPERREDPTTPGHFFIQNYGANPAWCRPLEIKETGSYQMVLRARGDFGGGAFPSIGLMLDEQDRPLASVRLVSSDWQRLPVGRPIHLEAGPHVLTARFLNDFNFGKKTDRNLFLDRYELVRVNGAGTPSDSAAMMIDPTLPVMSSPTPTDNTMMMASPAMDTMSQPESEGPAEATPRAAFRQVFDGLTIAGPLTFNAQAWWPQRETAPAPKVDLMVNGEVMQTQQGSDLVFRMPAAAFRHGENTVLLRARSQGQRPVYSTAQRIRLEAPLPTDAPTPRFFRYTAFDQAWDPGFRQRLEKGGNPSAAFYSNGESFLTLDEKITGTFRIKIDGRGQEFQGAPEAEMVLRRPDQPDQILSRVKISGPPQTVDANKVVLKAGPKQLVIRFVNDSYEAPNLEKKINGGDRNFWLKALILEEITEEPSAKGSSIAIRYPRQEDQLVTEADAVVADLFLSQEGLWSDLVIDDQPQNLLLRPENGLGPVLFPLLVRNLQPGPHRLKVILTNGQKVVRESNSIRFRVGTSTLSAEGPYQRALRLLNRFAFGPEPGELAALLTEGEQPWLEARLRKTWTSPAEQSALAFAATAYPEDQNEGQVVPRVLSYLLTTPNPVRARFLLWTQNHFSTWIQKTEGFNKWEEHLQFATLGPAPFQDLLYASATSPAMLVYLDQYRSYANKLNENYAREIMELHTLGVHGGYSQTDVTTLAKVLNGWTLSEESYLNGYNQKMQRLFRYDAALSDGQAHRVLGLEFPETPPEKRYDLVLQALEMLAAHPSTAHFVSQKLAEHYVSDPPPAALVQDLTKVYLQTGGDLRSMLQAIAIHPDFWAAQPKVATPIDFSLRFSRAAGAHNPGALNDFLRKSAMGLFDRATPDGYPEADNNYTDSNALLQRWRLSKTFEGNLNRFLPPRWLPPPGAKLNQAQAQRLVDLAALRMTGRLLSETSNEAAVNYVLQAETADPDRARMVAAFISQTPELSLR